MKDTAFPITSEDITLSNLIFNDLEACNELADSLQSRITNYEKTTKQYAELSDKKDEQISNLLNQGNLYQDMVDACDKAEKKKERKIKFLKFTRNVLIGIVVAEAGYIGYKQVFK